MNITYFMTWFISQVVTIFTWTYTTLNNITFGGTSLLKVIIFINIIIPFLYVILTIPQGAANAINEHNENIRKKNHEERVAADKSWGKKR